MPARDLTGGVDVSGFVGVDPMYQNYSDDTGKPLNNAEERQAIKNTTWGTAGASAVIEKGEKVEEDDAPPVMKTDDFGQVVTTGGDGGFAKATTVESNMTTAELEAAEKAQDEADAKAAKADEKAAAADAKAEAKTPAKE